jgi:hypothetical protein
MKIGAITTGIITRIAKESEITKEGETADSPSFVRKRVREPFRYSLLLKALA